MPCSWSICMPYPLLRCSVLSTPCTVRLQLQHICCFFALVRVIMSARIGLWYEIIIVRSLAFRMCLCIVSPWYLCPFAVFHSVFYIVFHHIHASIHFILNIPIFLSIFIVVIPRNRLSASAKHYSVVIVRWLGRTALLVGRLMQTRKQRTRIFPPGPGRGEQSVRLSEPVERGA